MKLPDSTRIIVRATAVEARVGVDRTGVIVEDALGELAGRPPSASMASPAHAPSSNAEADIPVTINTSRRESSGSLLMFLPSVYGDTDERHQKDQLH